VKLIDLDPKWLIKDGKARRLHISQPVRETGQHALASKLLCGRDAIAQAVGRVVPE
jgi:hypothetical protein